MKWSLQELFMALSWASDNWWWYKIIHTPKRLWRRLKIIIHWIFTGYTYESLWNLDSWLDSVILFRLKKFKNENKNSYPCDFKSHDDWHKTIDIMIEGFNGIINDEYFKNYHDYLKENGYDKMDINEYSVPKEIFDKCREDNMKLQDKKDLFWKYYNNLWD